MNDLEAIDAQWAEQDAKYQALQLAIDGNVSIQDAALNGPASVLSQHVKDNYSVIAAAYKAAQQAQDATNAKGSLAQLVALNNTIAGDQIVKVAGDASNNTAADINKAPADALPSLPPLGGIAGFLTIALLVVGAIFLYRVVRD